MDPAQVESRLKTSGKLPQSGKIERRSVNEMGFHEIRGPNGEPIAFMKRDAVLKAATDTEPEQRGIRFIPNPLKDIAPEDRRRGEFWETSRTLEANGPGRSLISLQALGSFQAPLNPEMLGLLRSFKSFVVPDRVRMDLKIAEKMAGSALDHLEAGGAAFSISDFKDLAKDLKRFHEAAGLHLDITLGNVLVHPSSGLLLADFDGAVFRNDIKELPTIDFAAVDAETADLEDEERLISHLRDHGQAIDEFMLLKTIASGLGYDERELDIQCLNDYAQRERCGESLGDDDAADQIEAMANLKEWLQTIAKPEHVDEVLSLVLDPGGFQGHHLYDMLNFALAQ